MLAQAWLSLRALRRAKCDLPCEVWHAGPIELGVGLGVGQGGGVGVGVGDDVACAALMEGQKMALTWP